MDYKIMRQHKYPEYGSLSGWQNKNINLNMTTEQAFQICLKEVRTWWEMW